MTGVNQDVGADTHICGQISTQIRFSDRKYISLDSWLKSNFTLCFLRKLCQTSDLNPFSIMLLSLHVSDGANFSFAQQLSVGWPQPLFHFTVSQQHTQGHRRENCVVSTQREISPPFAQMRIFKSFFHSHTLYEAVPPSLCLLLVCNDICFELQRVWDWLMLLQLHALALVDPQESLPGPRFVIVRFSGCSWGTAELITRCDFHCFIQNFIMFQKTQNREILMRI